MSTASDLIDDLGGTSDVAKALKSPATTVSSWKTSGSIPDWRRDALDDLAKGKGASIDWETFSLIATCGACDRRSDDPACSACIRSDCGLRQKEAA